MKEGDVCTIRQFPANDSSLKSFKSSSAGEKAGTVLAWVLNPIGSLVKGGVTGDWNGSSSFLGLKEVADYNKKNTNSDTEKSVSESLDKSIETLPTISGAMNTSAQNTAVPFFLGKHLYTPRYCGQPYTSIEGQDGQDQYINILYMCGYNDISVKDLKFGIFELADNHDGVKEGYIPLTVYNEKTGQNEKTRFSDMKLEIHHQNESELYPFKVVQDNFDEVLFNQKDDKGNVYTLPLEKFSAKNPYKIELEFTLDGLAQWDSKGKASNASVQILPEYSFNGVDWYKFGQIGNGTGKYDASTGITTITKCKTQTLRYTCSRTFTYQDLYKEDFSSNLVNGAVFLRITRMNEQIISDDICDTVKLTAIRTTSFDRIKTESTAMAITEYADRYLVLERPVIREVREKTVRIALRVKATKENKEQIKELNFIGSSLCRKYENGEWSEDLYEEQNPASVALSVLQGKLRGDETYSDSEIDLESFGAFYNFCKGKGFKCNGVVMESVRTDELLNKILKTGRAFRVLNGTRQSVCYDDVKVNPVNIVNNQNCLSANNTKNIDELPDGYILTFQDENNFYQETEYVVCFDDTKLYNTNLKLEPLEIPFVTNSRQLYKLVKYHCACKKLRREIWNRKMSIDGNLIEVGNLVELQDDTIMVGVGSGAEIIGVTIENDYIVGVTVDNKFEITDENERYGLKIMEADGINEPVVIKKEIVNKGVGEYDYFEFVEPVSVQETNQPCITDLVSFGIYSKITIDGLCASKKSDGNGNFDIVYVPYDENIYTADTGVIPEFDSKVTSPTGKATISFENTANNATMVDLDRAIVKTQTTDNYGNVWISNSDYAPITAVKVRNATVYQLNENLLDENGLNSKGIEFAGELQSKSFFDNKNSFKGLFEKDISSEIQNVIVLTNASRIKIGNKLVGYNGNITEIAESINASTDWGLTQEQLNSDLFD